MSRSARLAVPLTASVAAAAMIWFTSPWGVGTTPDSIYYFRVALSYLGAEDMPAPGLKTPPLYPFTLATLALSGDDVFHAARVLQCALLALNACLLSILVNRLGGRAPVTALLVLGFLLSPSVYAIHYQANSEGLFLSGLLMLLIAFGDFLRDGKPQRLLLAAAALALMALTRYTAVPFIAVSCLFVLLPSRRSLTATRLAFACATGLLAVLPFAAWYATVSDGSGATSPRSMGWHPVTAATLNMGGREILGWLGFGNGALAVTASVGGLLGLGIVLLRNRDSGGHHRVVVFLMASTLAYLLFVLLSISLFDAYTPLDSRILLPAYVCFYAAVCAGFVAAWEALDREALRLAAVVVLTLALLPRALETTRLMSEYTLQGTGYFSRDISRTPILQTLRQLPQAVIYSNAPELIWLHTGIHARQLPALWNPVDAMVSENFFAEMAVVMQEVDERKAIVVCFSAFAWRQYLPGPELLSRSYLLAPAYEAADGTIFDRIGG